MFHIHLFVAKTAFEYQVSRALYDGVVYLNRTHKSRLKEEFGKSNILLFFMISSELEFVEQHFCCYTSLFVYNVTTPEVS